MNQVAVISLLPWLRPNSLIEEPSGNPIRNGSIQTSRFHCIPFTCEQMPLDSNIFPAELSFIKKIKAVTHVLDAFPYKKEETIGTFRAHAVLETCCVTF